MSEGYINVCDLSYFITIYTNKGEPAQYQGVLGVGSQPSSYMLNVTKIIIGLL